MDEKEQMFRDLVTSQFSAFQRLNAQFQETVRNALNDLETSSQECFFDFLKRVYDAFNFDNGGGNMKSVAEIKQKKCSHDKQKILKYIHEYNFSEQEVRKWYDDVIHERPSKKYVAPYIIEWRIERMEILEWVLGIPEGNTEETYTRENELPTEDHSFDKHRIIRLFKNAYKDLFWIKGYLKSIREMNFNYINPYITINCDFGRTLVKLLMILDFKGIEFTQNLHEEESIINRLVVNNEE